MTKTAESPVDTEGWSMSERLSKLVHRLQNTQTDVAIVLAQEATEGAPTIATVVRLYDSLNALRKEIENYFGIQQEPEEE